MSRNLNNKTSSLPVTKIIGQNYFSDGLSVVFFFCYHLSIVSEPIQNIGNLDALAFININPSFWLSNVMSLNNFERCFDCA